MKNDPLSKIMSITFQESRTGTYRLMSFWRPLSATTHCPADPSLLGHGAPTPHLRKVTVKRFCQVWSSQMCVKLLPGAGAELARSYSGKGPSPVPDWTHRQRTWGSLSWAAQIELTDSRPVAVSHGPPRLWKNFSSHPSLPTGIKPVQRACGDVARCDSF